MFFNKNKSFFFTSTFNANSLEFPLELISDFFFSFQLRIETQNKKKSFPRRHNHKSVNEPTGQLNENFDTWKLAVESRKCLDDQETHLMRSKSEVLKLDTKQLSLKVSSFVIKLLRSK